MNTETRGGKREGAGRKKTGRQKYKSFRVKIEHATLISFVLSEIKCRPDLPVAINRTIRSDNGKIWSEKEMLLSQMVESERGAAEAIAELKAQVKELQDTSEIKQLRDRVALLSGELFPALARLRQLEPAAQW